MLDLRRDYRPGNSGEPAIDEIRAEHKHQKGSEVVRRSAKGGIDPCRFYLSPPGKGKRLTALVLLILALSRSCEIIECKAA